MYQVSVLVDGEPRVMMVPPSVYLQMIDLPKKKSHWLWRCAQRILKFFGFDIK